VIRSAGAVAALLAGVVVPAAAQGTVEGTIARPNGRDTVPVPGAVVVLHRIGRDAQGPLDTVRSDAAGRFRFRFLPDSTATFLLSASHQGIEYFSRPVGGSTAADSGLVVLVSDTSSRQPVTVAQRTVLISTADASGFRLVLDWFVLRNRGPMTRIARDTLDASWGTRLPDAAQNVALADSRQSQFAAEALGFRSDSALVFAPISPGDKELLLQYRIPGSLRRLVIPAAVDDSVFVLLEERSARVVAPAFSVTDSQTIEGRRFDRLAGRLGGADAIEVRLSAPWVSGGGALALLVGIVAAGFGLLTWRALARRPRPAPAGTPESLAAAIARLDQEYEGREAGVGAEEWARYLGERARLRGALQRAMGEGGSG
jgi:hypothetical protein